MPRKKPKNVRRDQQRQAMDRMRQEKGWQPPEPDLPEGNLLDDLMIQFPSAGKGLPDMASAQLMADLAVDSHDLAEEPEFRTIYFHPMQSIDAYGAVEEKRGLSDEELEALPQEEQDAIFWEMIEQVTGELLTEDLQEQILAALEQLRQRARRSGDQDMVGHAAAVEFILSDDDAEDVWPTVGLVQALMHRSLLAGLEMVQVMEQASGLPGPGDVPDFSQVSKAAADETLQQQMLDVLTRYPGLQDAMAEADESVWEEGLNDLANGVLYIGFFSLEELEEGAELFSAALHRQGLDPEDANPDQAKVQAAFEELERHVITLLSAERLDEVREDLLSMVEDPELAGESGPFLLMLLDGLEQDISPEFAAQFLTPALLGEMLDLAEEQDQE